ncbi:MAG TPA: phosphatase PAP2 family protein [Thermoanaerobaculia bacterium]|nr:phosphatase PAP2 family protein [Thermoanaerobaculia bacterium]
MKSRAKKKEAALRPEPPALRRSRPDPFLPRAIGISGGLIMATVAFWFFKRQAQEVVAGSADRFDTALLDLATSAKGPRMDAAMRAATALGSHTAIGTAAGLTALVMIRRRRPHDAWTVLISTGGAMVLNTALKAIFQRQRPQELNRLIKLPKSHSFPSGHSLLSAATYPIVTHHLVERMPHRFQAASLIATAAIVGSVGYSRVYFAVHFPSDVLAGFAAGLGWLGLTSLSHTLADRNESVRRDGAGVSD